MFKREEDGKNKYYIYKLKCYPTFRPYNIELHTLYNQ